MTSTPGDRAIRARIQLAVTVMLFAFALHRLSSIFLVSCVSYFLEKHLSIHVRTR